MTKALVAHPGTQYASKLATELAGRDLLSRFWTGFAIPKDGWLERGLRMSGQRAQRFVANRQLGSVSHHLVRLRPFLELRAWTSIRRGASPERVFHARNAAFQTSITEDDLMLADVTIGFDTSSWILADRSLELGRPFILDQSIGHPLAKERAYEAARRQFPSWAASVPRKPAAFQRDEMLEHELATMVVTPSQFVRDTLIAAGIHGDRIRVNPFGTDTDLFYPAEASAPPSPLIFLFVGSISARKGVPVLLAAWRRACVRKAELWIVGPGRIPRHEHVEGIPDSVLFLGARSRQQVAGLMRRAHVFVFPSFFEGLAQVQVEALASCLPVIATHESGASDLVESGRTGLIIPAGDIDATIGALEFFNRSPDHILEMRNRLIQMRDRWRWSHYGDRWAAILRDVA